ncbi:MAG: hypothetical protein AB1546_04460 [bacterium]
MNIFLDLVDNLEFKSDEVLKFVTYPKGYYALLRSGRRLDIIHAVPFQPEIVDFDDYYTYLLVHADQGFFILRQQVKENQVCPWFVLCEFTPKESHQFALNISDLIPCLKEFVKSTPI